MYETDYDIKLVIGANTKAMRLLNTREGKAWRVSDTPEREQDDMRFDMSNWSFGHGLLRFTPQRGSPGHTLRYSEGFGIDTSSGFVKHGPGLLSDVGAVNANPIMAVMLDDTLFILTTDRLYSWTGSSLTSEWTNPDGTVNTSMVVYGDRIYIAASNTKYWHTTSTVSPTAVALATEGFLVLGTQLWRYHTTNNISSSINPSDAPPTWSADVEVGDGSQINNLFGLSGLLGVATENTLYIIDSDSSSIELNNSLRSRADVNAFSIKAESGSDVWFSDTERITRIVAQDFEVFDIRPDGPFFSKDELPITSSIGRTDIVDIALDLEAIYVVVQQQSTLFIFKGDEVARGLFVWSPLYSDSSDADFVFVGKFTADSDPILYFNDGTTIHRFEVTNWDVYASDWELETPYFTANAESLTKMIHTVRAFLDGQSVGTDTKVTVSYRTDNSVSYTLFTATGIMDSNGNNELSAASAIVGKRIALKFAGNTTDTSKKIDMLSFSLLGQLRSQQNRVFDFTVVADSEDDATFMNSLRSDETVFFTLTDRFGVDRTAYCLNGFPVELELIDAVRKEPVRAYTVRAKEII